MLRPRASIEAPERAQTYLQTMAFIRQEAF